MPRAEERRRRRLAQLIELEGGLNPPTRETQPGHYAIAQRVIDFEDSDKDFKHMAQSLRQVVRGKINLGPNTVKRIEDAYAADKRHGLFPGWFDDPDLDAQLEDGTGTEGTSNDPGNVVDTFGRVFTLYQQLPEEGQNKLRAQIAKLIASWERGGTLKGD